MTTPKPGNPKSGVQSTGEIELSSSIKELENLIADKAVTINTHPAIPVLDDEVDPDEIYIDEDDYPDELSPTPAPPDRPDINPEQLQGLIDNLENKLSGELDALVNILKDAIKDSIITEIKTHLETKTGADATSKPDGKVSD